jgi:hypothetical protein
MQQEMIQPPKVETEPATVDNVRVFDAEQAKLFPLSIRERRNADDPPITIPWFIDCHMHINSGHCTPIPLERERIGEAFAPGKGIFHHQWSMDLGSKMKPGGDFAKLNAMSTEQVGAAAIEHSKAVLDDDSLKLLGPTEKRQRILVNLPMDMDFAWYDGYEQKEIYYARDGEKEMGYWDAQRLKFIKLSKGDQSKYESYDGQIRSIKNIFFQKAGNFLAFYGFDPRRYKNDISFPFENCMIQTASDTKISAILPAIGFKLYTALGFKPLDPLIPKLSEFYKRCSVRGNEIPIICHGSMNGMDTHDIHIYYSKEHNTNEQYSPELQKKLKEEYFYPEFVSPYAWEKVLMNSPNLHICLAHFAGEHFWDTTSRNVDANRAEFIKECWKNISKPDPQKKNWIKCLLEFVEDFDNFYIDISYFIFKDGMIDYFKDALKKCKKLKERILFGTDWWIVTNEKAFKQKGYYNYFDLIVKQIAKLNDNELFKTIGIKNQYDLLAYFMVLNPMRFLRLKEISKSLQRIYNANPKRVGKFEIMSVIESIPDSIDGFHK